jgi:hypothetical protein
LAERLKTITIRRSETAFRSLKIPNRRAAKLPLRDAVDNHMQHYLDYLGISRSTFWFFLGKEPGSLFRESCGLPVTLVL